MVTYVAEQFLRPNDLREGLVYLSKDDYLRVYLGKSSLGEFVFYQLARVDTRDLHGTIILAREEIQLPTLCNFCVAIMNKPLDVDSIRTYMSIPKLLGVFPNLDFSSTYSSWYAQNILMRNLTNLPKLVNKPMSNVDLGYVRVKDLEVGRVYGNEWRNKWVYLGRGSNKCFVWLFIGNEDSYIKDSVSAANTLICNFGKDMLCTTGSNKRIKRNNQKYLSQTKLDLRYLSYQSKSILSAYGINCI